MEVSSGIKRVGNGGFGRRKEKGKEVKEEKKE